MLRWLIGFVAAFVCGVCSGWWLREQRAWGHLREWYWEDPERARATIREFADRRKKAAERVDGHRSIP